MARACSISRHQKLCRRRRQEAACRVGGRCSGAHQTMVHHACGRACMPACMRARTRARGGSDSPSQAAPRPQGGRAGPGRGARQEVDGRVEDDRVGQLEGQAGQALGHVEGRVVVQPAAELAPQQRLLAVEDGARVVAGLEDHAQRGEPDGRRAVVRAAARVVAQAPVHRACAPGPAVGAWPGCGLQVQCMRRGAGGLLPRRQYIASGARWALCLGYGRGAGCSRGACGAELAGPCRAGVHTPRAAVATHAEHGRAGWCQAGVHVPRAAQHRPTASSIGRGHGEVQGEGRPPSSSAAMMYCAACTTRCTGLRPHERRKRLLSTRICAAPHARALCYSAFLIGHHNEKKSAWTCQIQASVSPA